MLPIRFAVCSTDLGPKPRGTILRMACDQFQEGGPGHDRRAACNGEAAEPGLFRGGDCFAGWCMTHQKLRSLSAELLSTLR